MGSGVVTLAVPQGAWPVLAVKLNEPVVRPMLQDENGLFSMDALPKLLALAEKADALLIGCGLGRSDTLTEIVCTLLEKAACQIVLDADGINSITGHKVYCGERQSRSCSRRTQANSHGSAASRMRPLRTRHSSRRTIGASCSTRDTAPAFSRRTAAAIAIPRAIPAWRKAAAGMFWQACWFRCADRAIDAVPAACTAAWLHGRAGDLAANALSEYGMTPSDMLTQLPILLKRYNSKTW